LDVILSTDSTFVEIKLIIPMTIVMPACMSQKIVTSFLVDEFMDHP
jgi:hypothetical protein